MVAISSDTPAEAQQLAAEMKISYPILSDNSRSLIRAYGVLHPSEGISRPAVFIVNKEGKIAWKYVGMEAGDRPMMDTILRQLQGTK